ncbi:hypothetical protein BZA05DRAFT_435498 [Tricharina praecox]|uniref:uncharacterized protein n=1 Tax=Tricharina praecox TaxID=43433 RepID=UPI0022212B0F|nr:uncharacterized protein BZA05DRAFT_435498 [Tricharina praecox]KAI5853740.1 hypothetical protein BZA05DRAFT_435498 [Tricharina praecox]
MAVAAAAGQVNVDVDGTWTGTGTSISPLSIYSLLADLWEHAYASILGGYSGWLAAVSWLLPVARSTLLHSLLAACLHSLADREPPYATVCSGGENKEEDEEEEKKKKRNRRT